jgi:hypothetical protein
MLQPKPSAMPEAGVSANSQILLEKRKDERAKTEKTKEGKEKKILRRKKRKKGTCQRVKKM